MFQTLTERLSQTFSGLRGRGVLTEDDVQQALRDIRRALLEADVALPVAKQIVNKVKAEAVGAALTKSVKPGEQVIKLVHDALIETLGEPVNFELKAAPPAVVLMCGLQGSGKTTSAAKLARWLQETQGKQVMLASLDVYRPAAQQQLQTLAERTVTPMLDIREGEQPLEITRRALDAARAAGADVLILDTAGRLEVDETLMTELQQVKTISQPAASLLVADALTGQVAVQVAARFQDEIGINGLIFTRVDGDGRGGAILSVRAETGVPIYFLGMGEDVTAFETYRPQGIADRLLDKGDVVSFVEKMQGAVDEDEAAGLQAKLMSGQKMNLDDLAKQIRMMKRMGGFQSMLGFMPGMGKLKDKINPDKMDKKALERQLALISSMTPKERKKPDLLNARRRQRIAAGSGQTVADVNKLVKMLDQMNKMTKMFKDPNTMRQMQNMLK